MPETWLKVVGDPEYEVSDQGRVRSLGVLVHRVSSLGKAYSYRMPAKVLRPGRDGGGYLTLILRGRTVKIHRLVATAFIREGALGEEVNHRDGFKRNNAPNNLEWCTRSENMRHAYRLGLKRPVDPPGVAVTATCVKTGTEHHFTSMCEAARQLLGSAARQAPISHCVSGKHKTAYGYYWKRNEDETTT